MSETHWKKILTHYFATLANNGGMDLLTFSIGN